MAKRKTISIGELKPAPYNPRVDLGPGDAEYESIKASLEEFGLVQPIVWNERSGCVVGGHQRIKVLADLGRRSLKVGSEVFIVDLEETEEKRLNLALNNATGQWDEERLAHLLTEIFPQDHEADSLLATGFSPEDLQAAYNLVVEAQQKDGEPAAQAPTEFPEVKPADVQEQTQHECPRCRYKF